MTRLRYGQYEPENEDLWRRQRDMEHTDTTAAREFAEDADRAADRYEAWLEGR